MVHRAGHGDVPGDVVLDEVEVRPVAQVRDVVEVAGQEVVHDHHTVPLRQQQVGEMGAEEAGAPGDDGYGLFAHTWCGDK